MAAAAEDSAVVQSARLQLAAARLQLATTLSAGDSLREELAAAVSAHLLVEDELVASERRCNLLRQSELTASAAATAKLDAITSTECSKIGALAHELTHYKQQIVVLELQVVEAVAAAAAAESTSGELRVEQLAAAEAQRQELAAAKRAAKLAAAKASLEPASDSTGETKSASGAANGVETPPGSGKRLVGGGAGGGSGQRGRASSGHRRIVESSDDSSDDESRGSNASAGTAAGSEAAATRISSAISKSSVLHKYVHGWAHQTGSAGALRERARRGETTSESESEGTGPRGVRPQLGGAKPILPGRPTYVDTAVFPRRAPREHGGETLSSDSERSGADRRAQRPQPPGAHPPRAPREMVQTSDTSDGGSSSFEQSAKNNRPDPASTSQPRRARPQLPTTTPRTRPQLPSPKARVAEADQTEADQTVTSDKTGAKMAGLPAHAVRPGNWLLDYRPPRLAGQTAVGLTDSSSESESDGGRPVAPSEGRPWAGHGAFPTATQHSNYATTRRRL